MNRVGIVLAAAALVAANSVLAQSSSNGAYGGYLGSDTWFQRARQAAANRAAIEALARRRGEQTQAPAGFVTLEGQIVFPGGNPFPKGRIPDLRIRCRDTKADSVERAPFVSKDGAFRTQLERGQTYHFFWMGFFGGLDKPFATLTIRPDGPGRRTVKIPYRAGSGPAGETRHTNAPTGAYTAPSTGKGYVAPTVGPGFVRPGTR